MLGKDAEGFLLCTRNFGWRDAVTSGRGGVESFHQYSLENPDPQQLLISIGGGGEW